jgi:hypothetical protein
MGSWAGGPKDDVNTVIYAHVTKLQLEIITSVLALHLQNSEYPQCKGAYPSIRVSGIRHGHGVVGKSHVTESSWRPSRRSGSPAPQGVFI